MAPMAKPSNVEDRVIQGQRYQRDAERDVKKELEAVLGKLEKLSKPIIEQLGRERQIHLIFSRSAPGLIYADPTADITAEVITRLNGGAETASK